MNINNDKCRYKYTDNCLFDFFGFCIIKYGTIATKLNCGGKGFAVILHTGGNIFIH